MRSPLEPHFGAQNRSYWDVNIVVRPCPRLNKKPDRKIQGYF